MAEKSRFFDSIEGDEGCTARMNSQRYSALFFLRVLLKMKKQILRQKTH